MKHLLLVGVLLVMAMGTVFAAASDSQTVGIGVSAIHELAIVGDAPLFAVGTPTQPGGPPVIDDEEQAGGYLQYTVIPTATTETASITFAAVAAIPGLVLSAECTGITAGGAGGVGTAGASYIDTADAAPNTVVSGITACYTGIGATDGAALQYKLAITATNFGNLYASTTAWDRQVTYTVAED